MSVERNGTEELRRRMYNMEVLIKETNRQMNWIAWFVVFITWSVIILAAVVLRGCFA